MKKNKLKSQQLSLTFDNDNIGVNYFQPSHKKESIETSTFTCKVISMNSYKQVKHNKLTERFYSLSDHLE